MAITTRDGLISALASGQKFDLFKATATSEGAGIAHSLWKIAGVPTAGTNPPGYTVGSGYVPTNATGGAIPFTNPTGGNLSYLLQLLASTTVVGKLIIYDRLWACSGFSTSTATTLTITTPGALTRPSATGTGVEAWFEVYTTPGATGANWTMNYTNTLDQPSSGVYVHPANAEAVGSIMPIPLAAGDLGVNAVSSITISVGSGAAGDIGITLLRRIAELPMNLVNAGDVLDAFFLGMPQIYDSACLAMMVMCSTTTTGVWQGSLRIGQG